MYCPALGNWCDGDCGECWKTWRRPTLPCLKTQYHGRWGFSRPSSGWDRVRSPRQSHQVVQHSPLWARVCCARPSRGQVLVWDCVVCSAVVEACYVRDLVFEIAFGFCF